MLPGQFSRTALGAASHRAIHQIREGGRVFADPLAIPILGESAEALLAREEETPFLQRLRLFIAARSRFAEDAAERAVDEGARQIVILGAGLDTFAYRFPPREGLRFFEVDHPATQAEKRRLLAAAGVAIPDHLAFAPCDFEAGALEGALRSLGFDPARRAVYIWLGVTPYLTPEAILSTLGLIAAGTGGAEAIFDYANPPDAIQDAALRGAHQALAERVSRAGEPFRGYLETPALHARLRAMGFETIEDLGPADLAARSRPGAPARGSNTGGHVIRVAKPARA